MIAVSSVLILGYYLVQKRKYARCWGFYGALEKRHMKKSYEIRLERVERKLDMLDCISSFYR